MWRLITSVLLCLQKVNALWDENVECPTSCTCSLVHLTETSVYGLKNRFQEKQTLTESDFHLNNEVIYDDNFEAEDFLLRSVTCLLQTETDPDQLLQNLPKDIESLRFIQGFESGNKTILFSTLLKFEELKILELQGTVLFLGQNNDSFVSLFDAPLLSLEYLNMENVHIKKGKKSISSLEHKINDDGVIFEYTQQLRSNLHPLTIIQKGPKDENILPYSKFKEEEETDLPNFVGFSNLELLRVSNCRLNILNWEMFEGLHKLQHLILEKNSIMFLPDFVFYGTPNLKSLSLAWNNLLSIQVTDLAGLLELEYLDVSHNNFSQLSELSLPPFPKLKLADFKNNPITAVFPSTFEVLNTTDSLMLGSTDTSITLIANSFAGLKLLEKLTLENVLIFLLKRELLFGMPNLRELDMSGNISEIEYDAFLETYNLERLILSRCKIRNVSMDAFMGLTKLRILDLSRNNLMYLPPNVFDPLTSLKELYLNENNFTVLPMGIFSKFHPKLIRLNQNPWHCSCHMSDWKPMVINKVKQKHLKICDFSHDKSVACPYEDRHDTKYIFDNRVAPKCASPNKFKDWSVFHVMRKQLGCPEFRPKLKKTVHIEKYPQYNTNITDDKLKELYYLKKKILEPVPNLDRTHNYVNGKINFSVNSTSNNNLLTKTGHASLNPKKSPNGVNNIDNTNSATKLPFFITYEMPKNEENNQKNDLSPIDNNYKVYTSLMRVPNLIGNSYSDNKMLKSLEHSSHIKKVKRLRKKVLKKTKSL